MMVIFAFLRDIFYKILPYKKQPPRTPEFKKYQREDTFFRNIKGDTDKAKMLQGFLYRK